MGRKHDIDDFYGAFYGGGFGAAMMEAWDEEDRDVYDEFDDDDEEENEEDEDY